MNIKYWNRSEQVDFRIYLKSSRKVQQQRNLI